MSEYSEALESYQNLLFQADQVLERELKEPIVIKPCSCSKKPLKVFSISTLHGISFGVRLRVGSDDFMRVHNSFGWVRWDGVFVKHSEVFHMILSVASQEGSLTISRCSS